MTGRPITRQQWLMDQDFTLVLSAGFFGFYAHAGLLLALEEAGLRPRRVVGTSAGALAGGLWASGLAAQHVGDELLALRREDFWDPGVPLGGLLRGRKFDRQLRRVMGPTGTVRVEHCPVPFTAVVHDVLRRRSVALSSGDLGEAIRASCAVPFMFRPVWSGGALLVDGGVSDRVGQCALAPRERVLVHYLPSRRAWVDKAVPVWPADRGLVLVTPDLPPLGPFALGDRGRALQWTCTHARSWLAESLPV